MNEMKKTKQLLYYIISKHPRASVTVLMKLSYLIDLVSLKDTKEKISEFDYKRYFYGPFDSQIYVLLEKMLKDGKISASVQFTLDTDYPVYTISKDMQFDLLTSNEIQLIDKALKELIGYGARTLTEIAYKTKPMKKLGATLGGSEHLNESIKLQNE